MRQYFLQNKSYFLIPCDKILVETLFQLSDDSFVIRIDKRLESTTPGTKVEKQERMKSYIMENNPTMWLLNHGHEQLASFMFPSVSQKIESDCSFDEEDEQKYAGETMYGSGETKGETFRGKPPL